MHHIMERVRVKFPGSKWFNMSNLAAFTGKEVVDIYTSLDKHFKKGSDEYKHSLVNLSRYIIIYYPELVSVEQIHEIRRAIRDKSNRCKKKTRKKVMTTPKNDKIEETPVKKFISPVLNGDEVFVVIDSKYSKLKLDYRDIATISHSFNGFKIKNEKIECAPSKIGEIVSKFQDIKYFQSFHSYVDEKHRPVIKLGYFVPIYIYAVAAACDMRVSDMTIVKIKNVTEGLARKEIIISFKKGGDLRIKPLCDVEIFSGNLVVSHDHHEFTARISRIMP